MRLPSFLALILLTSPQFVQAASTESTFLQIRNKYARIQATLNLPKQPARIAIVQAHPWGNSLDSFPAADLAAKGFAVLSFNTRDVNKEEIGPDGIFEKQMLDVAAAVQEMKDRSYEKIIIYGGSAGGPLMSLYQNVAENGNKAFAGERKLYKFPGFFEKDGAEMRLPPAVAILFRNPIDGTSTSFLDRLDPSITDEAGVTRDPSLDMFNPANGYNPKTQSASYSKAFIEKYGRAQAARMNRLIDTAMGRAASAKSGKGRFTDGDVLVIPGTRARLFYTDMSLGDGAQEHLVLPENKMMIPKNDRAVGHYSLFGEVPDRNKSVEGVIMDYVDSFLSFRAVRAKFINPMATRLEDWGVDVESTNNLTVANMMHVSVPWLLLSGTADDKMNSAELIYNSAKSKDKMIIMFRGGTHPLAPVDPKRFGTTEAMHGLVVDQVAKWINARFQ
jgi:hypothetical protein